MSERKRPRVREDVALLRAKRLREQATKKEQRSAALEEKARELKNRAEDLHDQAFEMSLESRRIRDRAAVLERRCDECKRLVSAVQSPDDPFRVHPHDCSSRTDSYLSEQRKLCDPCWRHFSSEKGGN